MTATDSAREQALRAAKAAADKLAKDIVIIDVSDRLAITDCFVIATGSNERQVQAIVDEVEEKMREAGLKPIRREGERNGRWVLLDYNDIVVHVQHGEERVFYALEKLWRDCPTFVYEDGEDGPNLTVEKMAADTEAARLAGEYAAAEDSPLSGFQMPADSSDYERIRAEGNSVEYGSDSGSEDIADDVDDESGPDDGRSA